MYVSIILLPGAADAAQDRAHGEHFADIRRILQLMYKHYHRSPKAMRDLKAVADAMGEKSMRPTNLKEHISTYGTK